jgi:hypothetical protein
MSLQTDLGLTMFTTCKGFTAPFDVIQSNAIKSWKAQGAEVLVIGSAEGAERAAASLEFRYLPDVACAQSGVPLLKNLFEIAELSASHGLICYANSDIVLANLGSALQRVVEHFEQFLVVGQRHNTRVEGRLDFSADWQMRLRDLARNRGELEAPCAVDYFAFRRGLYQEIPPFIIARLAWDNWLVWDALRRQVPVIDATPVVTAVHQMHAKPDRSVDDPEWRHNRQLFADCVGLKLSDLSSIPLGFVSHSTWILGESGPRLR